MKTIADIIENVVSPSKHEHVEEIHEKITEYTSSTNIDNHQEKSVHNANDDKKVTELKELSCGKSKTNTDKDPKHHQPIEVITEIISNVPREVHNLAQDIAINKNKNAPIKVQGSTDETCLNIHRTDCNSCVSHCRCNHDLSNNFCSFLSLFKSLQSQHVRHDCVMPHLTQQGNVTNNPIPINVPANEINRVVPRLIPEPMNMVEDLKKIQELQKETEGKSEKKNITQDEKTGNFESTIKQFTIFALIWEAIQHVYAKLYTLSPFFATQIKGLIEVIAVSINYFGTPVVKFWEYIFCWSLNTCRFFYQMNIIPIKTFLNMAVEYIRIIFAPVLNILCPDCDCSCKKHKL